MGRTKATTGPDRAAQTTAGKAWAKACAAAVDAATLMAGLSGTAASLPAARAQTAFGSMADVTPVGAVKQGCRCATSQSAMNRSSAMVSPLCRRREVPVRCWRRYRLIRGRGWVARRSDSASPTQPLTSTDAPQPARGWYISRMARRRRADGRCSHGRTARWAWGMSVRRQ